jgi:hypothetical protein
VAVQLGLCEGPITSVGNVYVDKNITSLSSLGLDMFTGTYPQDPWGYLITNHAAIPGEQHTVPGGAHQVTVNNAATFMFDNGVTGRIFKYRLPAQAV